MYGFRVVVFEIIYGFRVDGFMILRFLVYAFRSSGFMVLAFRFHVSSLWL